MMATVTFRRALLAMVVLLAALSAYAVPVGIVLHQAARLAGPGDRIVVVFRPGTPTDRALEQLGSAGSVLATTTGVPWFYTAELVDPAAAAALARQGVVLRVPQEPTLAGCFAMLKEGNGTK